MPGFQELIIKLSPIIIGVGIVLAGVTRLRKKLSTEAQPTLGTYINELGGYIVAALVALAIGIYLLFFDQSSRLDNQNVRKPGTHAAIDDDHNAEAIDRRSRSHSANEAEASKPDWEDVPGVENLLSLAGTWEVSSKSLQSGITATAWRLKSEPWIAWLTKSPSGEVLGIELSGYDTSEDQFIHFSAHRNAGYSTYVGKWNENEASIEWNAQYPDGSHHQMLERVGADELVNNSVFTDSNNVAGETTITTLKRLRAERFQDDRSTILDRYLGQWSMTAIESGKPDREQGTRIVTALEGSNANIERLYTRDGALSLIALVDARNDGIIRRLAINDSGLLSEMLGSWNDTTHSITWRPKDPEAPLDSIQDRFDESGFFETSLLQANAEERDFSIPIGRSIRLRNGGKLDIPRGHLYASNVSVADGEPQPEGKWEVVSVDLLVPDNAPLASTNAPSETLSQRNHSQLAPSEPIVVQKNGDEYRVSFDNETWSVLELRKTSVGLIGCVQQSAQFQPRFLMRITGKSAEVYFQTSGDGFVAPADILAPMQDDIAKFRMRLVRHLPSSIHVTGPRGAKVSIGEWQAEMTLGEYEVKTESLSPINAIPYDVVIEVAGSEGVTRDRQRVYVTGGSRVSADFTDWDMPNTRVRTLRYWSSCRRVLYFRLNEASEVGNNANRTKSIAALAADIRSMPVRGVDKEAIEKWLAVVSACEEAANSRSRSTVDIVIESILRGANGDPFGTAIDLQQSAKAEAHAFSAALSDVKNLTPVLTQRYDTEFPIP